MAVRKIFDAAIKTRSYQDQRTGETKAVWQTIGAVWEDDAKGSKWLTLHRWFNPAGVPDFSGRGGESLLLSMFEPKDQNGNQQGGGGGYQQQGGQQQQQRQAPPQQQRAPQNQYDDDIPFK